MGTERAGQSEGHSSPLASSQGPLPAPVQARFTLLYHFCRLQLPAIGLDMAQPAPSAANICVISDQARRHGSWTFYLDNLYPLDWFVASACLEGSEAAWETLFAAKAGRSDCLLMDALRARAARLYPRDEEKQDSAVNEFWGHLIIAEHDGSLPVLERYDGQRPLVPWLIRVFQNWHISQLRRRQRHQGLAGRRPGLAAAGVGRRPALARGLLPGGPRVSGQPQGHRTVDPGPALRYRLSQREVAAVLGKARRQLLAPDRPAARKVPGLHRPTAVSPGLDGRRPFRIRAHGNAERAARRPALVGGPPGPIARRRGQEPSIQT